MATVKGTLKTQAGDTLFPATSADKVNGVHVLLSNYSEIATVTVSTTQTAGTSPYSSSYYYTNFTVDTDKAGITESELKNGTLFGVLLNTSVSSSYRNMRIRFGSSGTYYPIYYGNSITSGYGYFANTHFRLMVFNKGINTSGCFSIVVDNNSTYANYSFGNGYGTCATAEATTEKAVTFSNYSLQTNGIVAVKFTYAVPASATMNINTRGAKNIFYHGAAITAGIIGAGDIATFVYDGTQYQLLSIDQVKAAGISGLATVATSGSFTDLTSRPKYNGTTMGSSTDIPEVKTSTWDGKQDKIAATGSSTKPVYFSAAGTVASCTYELKKTVPSDAIFTDTNYYHTSGSWNGLTYTATGNGGASDLTFTVPTGSSATTVAVGNHNHNTVYTTIPSSGGSASQPLYWDSQDSSFKTCNSIPSLSGYATQSWVTDSAKAKSAGSADSATSASYFGTTSYIGTGLSLNTTSHVLSVDTSNTDTSKAIATQKWVNDKGYTTNTGTVTSVSAGTGLSISGTASTTPTVNIASGYKLPSSTEWSGKQDTISGSNSIVLGTGNVLAAKVQSPLDVDTNGIKLTYSDGLTTDGNGALVINSTYVPYVSSKATNGVVKWNGTSWVTDSTASTKYCHNIEIYDSEGGGSDIFLTIVNGTSTAYTTVAQIASAIGSNKAIAAGGFYYNGDYGNNVGYVKNSNGLRLGYVDAQDYQLYETTEVQDWVVQSDNIT